MLKGWLRNLQDPPCNENGGQQWNIRPRAEPSSSGPGVTALVTLHTCKASPRCAETSKWGIAEFSTSDFSVLPMILHQILSKHKSTSALIGYPVRDLLPGLCLCGLISLWHGMNSLAPRCCYPLTIPVFLIIVDSIFLCPICYCLPKRDVRFP